ncbi:MAG: S8 family serine peptidase [Actinomycetota bacterium]|nr:S8 family serine peptidase [Actinomycetota bacterium]
MTRTSGAKRVIRTYGALAVLAVSLTVVPNVASGAQLITTQTPAPYVVVLDDGIRAELVAGSHAASLGLELSHVYSYALQGYSATMTPAVASLIADLPGVAWVQPDRIVEIAGQKIPSGVRRIGATGSATAAIDGRDSRVHVDVAVLDTGVDLTHPDLNVRGPGANCTLGGLLPPELGEAWPDADDAHGHGTHVAGTIGALDNRRGVVGVAPGARIWPVKVLLDGGTGMDSMLLCGIDYVTQHADKVDIANLSLVREGSDDGRCGESNADALHKAICGSVRAGVAYVVAAGNKHMATSGFVPAAYDEVVTVSALADFDGRRGELSEPNCAYADAEKDDSFADISNFGVDVDVIAPGVCIRSTSLDGGYATQSGTSMASAHISGAAALYQATHPGAGPSKIKAALSRSGVRDWRWPSQDKDQTQETRPHVASF